MRPLLVVLLFFLGCCVGCQTASVVVEYYKPMPDGSGVSVKMRAF